MIRWIRRLFRKQRPKPKAAVSSERELAALRLKNNPNKEPTGHYTGRCMRCGSRDLWDDASVYGCNCCGEMFAVGHLPPLIIPSKP